MLPYTALEALVAVIDEGSFQGAAAALRITQSAVSQRIALLEEQLGERILVRGTPPSPTQRGTQLITHARSVMEMERTLMAGTAEKRDAHQKIKLGINADSVESWLFFAAKELVTEEHYLLHLIIENEAYTFERMRAGEFFSCISSEDKPLPGCDVELLGRVDYRWFCTPRFRKQHFPDGRITLELAKIVPTVLFDTRDYLHQHLLEKIGISTSTFPHHIIPSSRGLLTAVINDMAYGVMPTPQVRDLVKAGKLVNLHPEARLEQPWYWHYQRNELPAERHFRKSVIRKAKDILRSKVARA